MIVTPFTAPEGTAGCRQERIVDNAHTCPPVKFGVVVWPFCPCCTGSVPVYCGHWFELASSAPSVSDSC
jgi:hypothetical protein